ncbi:uncharacterized protein DNG_09752 [Cephalotrichum gorgonifer]|uniref:Uncharacterized protein n=1 Tax=Cephalotrichum gorgonifer TaxID=2041049 RepID=A0AAE8N856_9PEZI|nr:uncharacterized protein DNG_09752 [Cephalotrichum gorgonifer]
MTSYLPGGPAVIFGGIIFFLSRLLLMIAHIILLIYELARSPWDNVTSSIVIVILFTVVACFVIVFLNPSDERSNLSQIRIAFASSLIQATVMTGLLIAYVMARPRVYLIVVHSLNLAIIYGVLGFNSYRYHKLRLAPPSSSLHIPVRALITGDFEEIQAARPDYTRKSRNANRKTKSGAQNGEPSSGEGKDDTVAGGEEPSQAPALQPHPLAITSGGDILVGGGDDERRWWEKW